MAGTVTHVGGERFFNPSSKQLYRDCLRLVQHVAEENRGVNVRQVRSIVKQQFMMNKDVTDPKKLEDLKNAAMRALTNYVMHLSTSKDKEWEPSENVFTDPDGEPGRTKPGPV